LMAPDNQKNGHCVVVLFDSSVIVALLSMYDVHVGLSPTVAVLSITLGCLPSVG
jgi:hypothetical protein